ncbi:SOS response-associated peptidase family protein [Paraferrimonas haliotis]|uniref:SOS response-associated peptidase family protein n=1 Tax=Paraferrimonas haliotis TaxID=2013866 RepID=UPI0015C7CA0C|nr:SOS response-associated peptidase family protein [Paraferrimonas haliotis]
MCGRFVQNSISYETRTQLGSDYGQFEFEGLGEVFPSQSLDLLLWKNHSLQQQTAQWGKAVEGLARPVINARLETLYEKPLFRGVQPALVVANAWVEWRQEVGGKRAFQFRSDNLLSMAAVVWQDAAATQQFAIVTCRANSAVRPYHHRMPLLLSSENIEAWRYWALIEQSSKPCPLTVSEFVSTASRLKDDRQQNLF